MRQLKLKIRDKDYILEYNRESIKWLESVGFSVEEFIKKPVTYREILWQSLFIKNYGNTVNPNLAIKLMDSYAEDKGQNMVNKVVKFAYDEYTSFLDALAGTNSEKTEEELEIINQ
jgi:predicted hydrolase (HD superfamily)